MTERERIDRFEAAYNRIDKELGQIIGDAPESRHGFAARVRIASHKRRRLSRFTDFLLEIGELRNALIHSRTDVDRYLAVPSEETVAELEFISNTITAPPSVSSKFTCRVVKLHADQPISDAWELIRKDGYSRYPVYDHGRFLGLLTANGFTRWCAAHVRNDRLDADLSKVLVSDVLEADHRRDAVTFIAADAAIDDAALLFADNPRLESILITQHGRPDESPLGIISGGDMAAALQSNSNHH